MSSFELINGQDKTQIVQYQDDHATYKTFGRPGMRRLENSMNASEIPASIG